MSAEEINRIKSVLLRLIFCYFSAYATLEARVKSAELPVGPSPQKATVATPKNFPAADISENPVPNRARDLLPLLAKQNQGRDDKLEALATRLQDHFRQTPEGSAKQDLKVLEQKIVSCIRKLLKTGATERESLVKRLHDLEDRLNKKINRSNKMKKRETKSDEKIDEGLNIIQWYPEGENSESVGSNPLAPKQKDSVNTSSENEDLVSQVENERKKKTKKENSENTPPKTKQTYKDPKKKCKESNKCDTTKKVGKYLKERAKGCEQGRNKTGAWYLERGKAREMTRRAEAEAEVQGEWQFARGRRDLRKQAEDKALWYFRRFSDHARSRQ